MNSPRYASTTEPIVPDERGFELALKDVFGDDPVSLNALGQAFPFFLFNLRDGSWAEATQVVQAALQMQLISQQQYDGIAGAAATYRIPLTL